MHRLCLAILLCTQLLVGGALAAEETPAATAAATPPAETTNAEENAMISADFSNAPTNINSDTLILKSKAQTFTYKDNVVVTQGDLKITSDVLNGTYDENNEIVHLTAEGTVVITKGPAIRATGKKAHYVKASETMTLTGSPEVTQEGSTLAADKIVFFLKEDRSTAEGNVRVKMVQDKKEKDGTMKNIKSALK